MPRLHALGRPLVIGDPVVLERALKLAGGPTRIRVQVVPTPEEADPSAFLIPCLNVPGNHDDLSEVAPGVVDPRRPRGVRLSGDGYRPGPRRPH